MSNTHTAADSGTITPFTIPDPAGVGRASEPSTGQALDGTWRPRRADTGAEAPREGLATPSSSRIHLIAPDLTVLELDKVGVPARRLEGGAVDVVLGDGLAAFRLPSHNDEWLHDAIGSTGAQKVLDSIEWVEEDNDWKYLLVCIDDSSTMPAHATIQSGQRVAELMTTGVVPLADLAHGTRGAVTTLTEPEALRLGAMLDWGSEVSTAPTPYAVDLRTLPSHVAVARDEYNRANPSLTARDGQLLTAFDLIDEVPEKALEVLEKTGVFNHRSPYIWGATRQNVAIDETVDRMVTRIADIIATATQQADSRLPLVFTEPGTAGSSARLVSVTPSGEVIRWDTQQDVHVLLLHAIQPMTTTKDGQRPTSNIPSGLLGAVLMRLRAVCPVVEHIVFEPSIIGDRLVTTPGYHPAERTVLIMPHRARARWEGQYEVPEHPTEDDAQRAFEKLDELCADFPWAGPRDRARMMAAMLTSAARSAVTMSPGFAWDASEPGTGKSYAAQACRLLGQGSKALTAWTLGRGADVENEKRLGAALLTRSTRFFHNDEVRGPLGSPFIGKVITAEDGAETIRELGVSRLIPVTGIITTACGNNITIADDGPRRWVTIRMEKPLFQMALGRDYTHPDLAGYIAENRPALVAAAHTMVLRAIQQGPAFDIPTMNFSSIWSERILGALSWVRKGETSVATQAIEGWEKDVAGADPMVEAWGPALEYAWKVVDRPLAASEFAMAVLTSPLDLYVPEDLTGVGPRQRGARWSQALKGLRGRKVFVGERVFIVNVVDNNGRLRFQVNAHDIRALHRGEVEPLVREPLTPDERKARDARMKREVY
ncbi:hypothetical protein [Microbacterium sp. NPDC089695]|uniref:hypothetical protein n=1 Tax=Microbacterium sp. NPDC089695 TaxID=3364198 RepID=UPI00381D89C9